MRRFLVLLLVAGLWPQGFFASEAQSAVSDAAVLFLRIAPNARAAGMGEAFVAIADDASTTHWNPAGLGEYPLAHNWYQFKLTDDTHLRELAQQGLKGKLAPNFFEKFASWQIKGNEINVTRSKCRNRRITFSFLCSKPGGCELVFGNHYDIHCIKTRVQ